MSCRAPSPSWPRCLQWAAAARCASLTAVVCFSCVGCGDDSEPDGPVGSLQNDGLNPRTPDAGVDANAPPDRVACESLLTRPPTDCDPTLPSSWDIDCDEDGAPGAQMTSCDPESLLVHNPTSPPGRFDCNDDAAAVHPGAVEVWNDDVDSDCDGKDAPSCTALEDGLVERPPAVEPGDCDGSSLYFAGIVECPHVCDEGDPKVYFYLANAGSEAWQGDITVRHSDGGEVEGELSVAGPLAPGEVTLPIEVDYDPEVGIQLEVDAGDCSPGEIREQLEGVSPSCVR